MKNLLIVLIFSIFQTFNSQDHHIIEITDLTFDKIINSKPFLVVLYHIPWCGYCKELDPIFERTAALFSSRDIKTIQFGKVDGTTNHRMINEQGIQKFPTIKMYGNGKVVEYIGIRGENELFTWVNIQMNNGPREINTPEELKQLILKKDVLICYFGKMLSYDFLFFESIAKALAKEHEFFYCESEECRAEFQAQENSYVIFKSFEERRHDFIIESNVQKMINIIDSYSNPLLMKLNDNTINFIFEKNHPCLLIIKDKNSSISEEPVKTICQEKREIIRCIEIEPNSTTEISFIEYLGLSNSDVSTILLVEYNKNNGFLKKYKYHEDVVISNMRLFINNWEKKELKPFYKSQPIPSNYFTSNDIVKEIVGHVFTSVVMNELKDVIVLFHVPGCESCKEREEMFFSAAEKLSIFADRLSFVRIDASKNEVEYISEFITQYPSIKLFLRGKKSTYYDYDGETIMNKFIEWIKNQVIFPVEYLYKNEL